MFAYGNQLSSAARLVVCPSFLSCDGGQQKELELLARQGLTVVIRNNPPLDFARYKSERTRRILGVSSQRRLDLKKFSAEWLAALGGVTESGQLQPLEKRTNKRFGKGRIVRVPHDFSFRELADEVPDGGIQLENLPDGYLAEKWQTRFGAPFLQILATREGLSAADVALVLPGESQASAVWFLDRLRAEKLDVKVERGVRRVRLPELNDEFAFVLLGNTPNITLRPARLLYRCRAGLKQLIACSIINTTGKPANGNVQILLPDGWGKARPFQYHLPPGGTARVELEVSIPKDAVRRPRFVVFRGGGAVQRCTLFPENGRNQVISEQPAPPWNPSMSSANPPRLLGAEWRGVTAGESRDDSVRGHLPGVCFMPRSREWDPPREFRGRMARYGETIPRLGGPNFIVNSPDPSSDLEIRLSYFAEKPCRLQVYDGRKYHLLGELKATGKWVTETFRVPASTFSREEADRSQYPGRNIMFEIRGGGIHVSLIEARRSARRP